MKKNTNEITGSYHNEKTDWWSVALTAIIAIAVLLIIGEQTGITSLIFGTA